jgi:hypothetical protein
MRRLALALSLVAAVVAVGFPGGATAGWSLPRSSGGSNAKAKTLGTGAAPTATASGHKVTVSWTAGSYVGGGAPGGYVIKRYNATTNVLQTIGSACTGTITTLSCVESGVPTGIWKYTVTAATANWRGPESAKSANVVV